MLKLSSAQVAAVVAKGAETINTLTQKVQSLEEENATLHQKIASFERERLVEELATEMEEKGLNAGLTFEEKIAHLSRMEDLSSVREAVKMASGTGLSFGELSDTPGNGLNALDAFHHYLATGQAV